MIISNAYDAGCGYTVFTMITGNIKMFRYLYEMIPQYPPKEKCAGHQVDNHWY